MDDETQKIIADQMKNLPDDVKQAILSVGYTTKLHEITKRQRLLIDQAGKLEMETTLVMIGLEPLSDFIDNLQRELEISSIRAREIALDVSENIFKPIRDSLYNMNEENEVNEKSPEPEEKPVRFTNSSDINLNRDQILNEIENPSIIGQENKKDSLTKNTTPTKTTIISEAPSEIDVSKEERMIRAEKAVHNAEEAFNQSSQAHKNIYQEILEKIKAARDEIKSELIAARKKEAISSIIKKPSSEIRKEETEALSVWTPKEIETLPGQEVREVKNIPVIKPDLVQAKMSGTTFVSRQTVDIKPNSKLPEVEKKAPSSGVDPYREALS